MTRLTMAALHRMAKAVQNRDYPVVTIVTHPAGGGRYACWDKGCALLPHPLTEELTAVADGSYRITSRGLGPAVDLPRFTPTTVKVRMLPLLDSTAGIPRVPITPSPWLYERPPMLARLLDRPDNPPAAAVEDQWHAWTQALGDGPVWQTGDWCLLWAPDPTTRATGLLTTVHPRTAPTPPEIPPCLA